MTETHIPIINKLEDLEHELLQRLSSMLSCLEQETVKSGRSLEERRKMVENLRLNSSEISLALNSYSRNLKARLKQLAELDFATGLPFQSQQCTLGLATSCKEMNQD